MIDHEATNKSSQAGSQPQKAETHDVDTSQAIQQAEGAQASFPDAGAQAVELPVIKAEPERQQFDAPVSFYDRMHQPIDAIEKVGEWITRSGMFGVRKKEEGMILAMHAFAMKESPLELAKKYHLINGRLSMRADYMLAEFHRLGGLVRWDDFDGDPVTATFKYKGMETKLSYGMQNAIRAGHANNPTYKKYPQAMFRNRIISTALRHICPEAIAGIYTPDELSPTPISPDQEQNLFTNEKNEA